MLEHQKKILASLNQNKTLFRKELLKSFKWLEPDEIGLLLKWVQQNFGKQHESILNEIISKGEYSNY